MAGYEWSNKIQINKPNLTYFMVKNVFDKPSTSVEGFVIEKYLTLSLEVTVQYSSYLLIVRREECQGSFKISNDLDDMTIFISHNQQKLLQNVAEVALAPLSFAYYSYPTTREPRTELFAQFYSQKTKMKGPILKVEHHGQVVSFDILGVRLYASSRMSGVTKKIYFSYIVSDNEGHKRLKSVTSVEIPHLGISLIAGRRGFRKEILYMSMHEVDLKKEMFERDSSTHLKIRYFGIDNNCETISYYPILFSPKYSYENMRRMNWHHIDLYLLSVTPDPNKPTDKSIMKKIDVKLIGNVLKIEESFLHLMLQALEDSNKQHQIMNDIIMKGKVKSLQRNTDDLVDYKDKVLLMAANNFRTYDLKNITKATTYVNEMKISEHDFSISFKREPGDQAKAALNRYSKYLKSVGFDYVFSIEDLTLDFNKFSLENNLYPMPTVQQEVINQYKKDGIQSGIASILDLNLLGNPRKFAKEIKSGISDVVTKPDTGNQQGNLGQGVADGAGSLARHTAIGTLGSVSKITGTVANMTSKLTFDTEYIKERNKLKSEKAHGVMNDMSEGMNQLGFSVKDSITGVFTRPVEMAEKEGLLGAIKGSFIGLGGLFIKPITGILDFASGGTQQLKAGVDYDHLAPPNKRIRNPRAFYGDLSLIK